MSTHESLDTLRADCRLPGSVRYFNSAAHGLLPTRTRAVIDLYLDALQAGASEQDFADDVEALRHGLATEIGASTDEVAFCQNISAGLNMVMQGYPWQAEDELILCPEIEHPTILWVAESLRQRGVKVRTVAAHDGVVTLDTVVDQINPLTRMVAVSQVSYLFGSRVDLATLGTVCREKDIFLLVDAAQSVGFSRVNVHDQGMDGMVANTHKGILGVSGLGFLYVAARWIPKIRPLVVGGEERVGTPEGWDWTPTAKKFEVGHRNSLGATAALSSLRLVRAVGIDTIETEILALRTMLVNGLLAQGWRVAVPYAASHIVSIIPERASAADRVAWLAEEGVKVAARGHLIRFSLHGYNTSDDVAQTLITMGTHEDRG